MSYETLLYTLNDGVAHVTLNRPESKNALNPAMTDELTAVFTQMRRDDAVRSIVLSGAGGAFCSGGDVRAMGQHGPRNTEQRRAGMLRYRELATAMLSIDKPMVAAVDGVAYGAGFSMALMADMVIVSDRVRFSMVFHRIGLVPDLAAFYTLPRVVGLQRAKELVMSAREVGAEEAVRLNIAMEVTSADAVLPRALAIAGSLVGASGTAMSLSKQALQSSLQSDLTTMLDIEASAQAIAAGSDYAKESVRRFGAKEPAQFKWPA